MHRFACTLLGISAVLLTGCYYRTTFGQNTPPLRVPVRVFLTSAASQDLADKLGEQVHALDGRALSISADSLTIAVSRVERLDHLAVVWNGERVTLSRMDVAQIERRHFSAPMTALIAGGAIVTAVLLANGAAQCKGCR